MIRELRSDPRAARAQPTLHTAQGSVRAAHLVVAGNAWLQGLLPELERRIMPVGTYIGASTPLGAERAPDRQQHGRGRHRLGTGLLPSQPRPSPAVWWPCQLFSTTATGLRGVMQRRMHQVFPQLADVPLEQVWGGYVDITRNRARIGAGWTAICTSRRGSPAMGWPPGWPVRSPPLLLQARASAWTCSSACPLPWRPAAAHATAGGGDVVVQAAGCVVVKQ